MSDKQTTTANEKTLHEGPDDEVEAREPAAADSGQEAREGEASRAPGSEPEDERDAAEAGSADPATRIAALEAELDRARDEVKEASDQLLRVRADMDNLRKRSARDLEKAHKYALERFALELLPVRDSLELGLDAASGEAADVTKLREGTELTLKMLTTALGKHGIEEVDPAGEKFDPDLHQAMATQPSGEVAPGHVMTVYQKGYTLNERLLRPALVIVSAASESSGEAGGG